MNKLYSLSKNELFSGINPVLFSLLFLFMRCVLCMMMPTVPDGCRESVLIVYDYE